MLKNKNIICFASENWEYKGFQQTVMKRLARHNRILFVNAIGIRKVSLNLKNAVHYFGRLRRIFQRNSRVSRNLKVCNPWMIPLIYNRVISKFNRILIRIQFKHLLSELKFKKYILWIGTPSAAFILDIFRPELIVYNPVDRYEAFPFVNQKVLRDYEIAIASRSDLIICTSGGIKKNLESFCDNIHIVSHGVDFDHFNTVKGIRHIPEDIRNIQEPLIGYFGSLSGWVNDALLAKVACNFPQASLILLGKQSGNLGKLEDLKNVYLLGQKDFNELPDYLSRFDVCLIPFYLNELTESVDPTKLREYLCQGKPVVSINLPEVNKFKHLIYIAEDDESFISMVDSALQEDSPVMVNERIQIAKKNDWSFVIESISDHLADTAACKADKKMASLVRT